MDLRWEIDDLSLGRNLGALAQQLAVSNNILRAIDLGNSG